MYALSAVRFNRRREDALLRSRRTSAVALDRDRSYVIDDIIAYYRRRVTDDRAERRRIRPGSISDTVWDHPRDLAKIVSKFVSKFSMRSSREMLSRYYRSIRVASSWTSFRSPPAISNYLERKMRRTQRGQDENDRIAAFLRRCVIASTRCRRASERVPDAPSRHRRRKC